jgi:hypothetical protein
MTPGEEAARTLLALVLAVFVVWSGAWLETWRLRMIERMKKRIDSVDNRE